jgi:hypothetical protein
MERARWEVDPPAWGGLRWGGAQLPMQMRSGSRYRVKKRISEGNDEAGPLLKTPCWACFFYIAISYHDGISDPFGGFISLILLII